MVMGPLYLYDWSQEKELELSETRLLAALVAGSETER